MPLDAPSVESDWASLKSDKDVFRLSAEMLQNYHDGMDAENKQTNENLTPASTTFQYDMLLEESKVCVIAGHGRDSKPMLASLTPASTKSYVQACALMQKSSCTRQDCKPKKSSQGMHDL